MTSSELILLDTIKHSLFGIDVQYPIGADWSEVLNEAKLQTVSCIAVNGAPQEIQEKYQTEIIQTVVNYIQITCAQTQLVKLFEDHQIPLVILKGTSVSIYYPDPSYRSHGDIDFYVPSDKIIEAEALMRANGFEWDSEVKDSRHIKMHKEGLTYEMHFKFSYDDLNIERYLIDGLRHIRTAIIDDNYFPMLPELANGMVLLAHMRNHLKSGLGLRQIIDWMMYCDKVLDDDFWIKEFGSAVSAAGMTTLAVTVTALCQKYLGLKKDITWCKEADELLCDELMGNLLSSGNFGNKNGLGTKIETVIAAFRSEGFLRRLQVAGEINWKAYKKHHWLKPFCWAYQSFRYIRQGAALNRGEKINGDITRGNKRYEMLKKLGIA